MIYSIYLSIILLTILLVVIIKDRQKALKLAGTLTILSSILLVIIMFIIKLIIDNNINIINVSSITNYIYRKFIYQSLILLLIGISEIIVSKYQRKQIYY